LRGLKVLHIPLILEDMQALNHYERDLMLSKVLRINLVRLKVEENKRSECKGINEIGPPTHFIYEWIIIALFLLQLLGKLSLSMEMINLLYCDHPLKHFIIFHLNHIITLGDKIR
jgi:hypothetical protein